MVLRDISIEKKIILLVTFGFLFSAVISVVYFLQIEKQQIERTLIKQSRTLFGQILISRRWNAEHGGVYAYLRPGEKANPYLYKVGPGEGKKSNIEPEIQDQKGRKLGFINPALMTRELSAESLLHTNIRFHLTSLQLVNPDNAPDLFEKSALQHFERGIKFQIQYADIDGKPYFRYMEPLHIEKACLACHGFQGYKIGDVRGGVSISIPMSEELAIYRQSRVSTFIIGALVYLVIIWILILAIRRMIGRPLTEIVNMASRIGAEDFPVATSATHGDELGKLSRTLIATDKEIRKQHQELARMVNESEKMSRIDALTLTHNRHHLYLEAPRIFAQAERKNSSICTLMVDIDFFKKINDTYGHKTGDDALKLLASVIRPEIRSYDLFIRYGGEEFLIILPDTPAQMGLQIAERIRQRVENTPLKLDGGALISVSVSIGLYCSVALTLEQAIAHADEALYKAKNTGRNRVCVFEGDDRASNH